MLNFRDQFVVVAVDNRIEDILELAPFRLDREMQLSWAVMPQGVVTITLFDVENRPAVSSEIFRFIVETAGFGGVDEGGIRETAVDLGDMVIRQLIARFDPAEYLDEEDVVLGVILVGDDGLDVWG